MELSEQDRDIIDFKARINLMVKNLPLLECETFIDSQRTLLIICYRQAIANQIMEIDDFLEDIWITTGCLNTSIWLSNACVWEAHYQPGKCLDEPVTVELASGELTDFPTMTTATLTSAIKNTIEPALYSVIDDAVKNYLSSDDLIAVIKSRVMLILNSEVASPPPSPAPSPAAIAAPPTAKKTRAKASPITAEVGPVKTRKPRQAKAQTPAAAPAAKKRSAARKPTA